MGLDMYLYKATYIGGKYDFNNVSGNVDIFKNDERLPIDIKTIEYILEEKAYWRKANAIHRWFVDSVQGGIDNCGMYYVSANRLLDLVDTCKKVLADHELAEKLLPTQEGFFFGNTSYEQDYFDDLQHTVDALSDVKEGEEYYYHSSW